METAYKRTILDLYKPLLESFKGKNTLFICKAIQINRMGFTSLQKVELRDHFLTQFPSETQYTEFFNNPLFKPYSIKVEGEWFTYETVKGGFSLLIETESFKLRIKLLEAIIENLEKNPELNLELIK